MVLGPFRYLYIVESDSFVVTNLFNKEDGDLSEISIMVRVIELFSDFINTVLYSFCKLLGNALTHCLTCTVIGCERFF